MRTEHSLASVLYLSYLVSLTTGMGNSQNRGPLNVLIQESAIRKALKKKGYAFVALPSNVPFTQIREADNNISFSKCPITGFEGLLLTKTVIGACAEDLDINLPLPNDAIPRRITSFNFEKVQVLPNSEKPKFVLMRILAPHPPFVLEEIGESVQPDRPYFFGDATGFLGEKGEYIEGYIYFPDKDCSSLKTDMTLFNIFSAKFNAYFHAGLPWSKGSQYFSPWARPYEFTNVTENNKLDGSILSSAGN